MDWVIELVKSELKMKVNEGYTGNIEFQINMFEGGIGNLSITTKKSIKK
mgnify:FL=1